MKERFAISVHRNIAVRKSNEENIDANFRSEMRVKEKKGESFTCNLLICSELGAIGEEVKEKIKNHWTRARARLGCRYIEMGA